MSDKLIWVKMVKLISRDIFLTIINLSYIQILMTTKSIGVKGFLILLNLSITMMKMHRH